MNRRQFVRHLGIYVAALTAGGVADAALSAPVRQPQVAITLDDFVLFDTPTLSAAERNEAILGALGRHRLKAAMFVAGKYVDREANIRLVRRWDEQGHMIANHTYSHANYPDAEFREYADDVLKNEALLRGFSRYRKFLRFPYLKEGDTAEQRDRMRAFMKRHGYRNGHVTIDASDWYVDERLRRRLKENPKADIAPYREFYLAHLWERANYYDDLSRKVLGRSVRHTLLLHHNVLNGLFLGDVLQMFTRRGWRLIDAEEAFADPVFKRSPKTAPAGESLIWALAKETGRFDSSLRYPGEDGEYEKPKMDALGL
jgi:peptidoglycan/xylan/chitin deacetylase (PgdA/CDA1 family)